MTFLKFFTLYKGRNFYPIAIKLAIYKDTVVAHNEATRNKAKNLEEWQIGTGSFRKHESETLWVQSLILIILLVHNKIYCASLTYSYYLTLDLDKTY